jgi:hypothetical protein
MELDRETYSRAEENQNQQVAQAAPPQTAPQQDVTVERETQRTEMAQNRVTPVEEQQLPRTASTMPLFGLAGLLALGAGMAVRAIGSRS